jgi:hypothetical protein
MGYGQRALELLQAYYEGKRRNLDEDELPATTLPTVDKEVGFKQKYAIDTSAGFVWSVICMFPM